LTESGKLKIPELGGTMFRKTLIRILSWLLNQSADEHPISWDDYRYFVVLEVSEKEVVKEAPLESPWHDEIETIYATKRTTGGLDDAIQQAFGNDVTVIYGYHDCEFGQPWALVKHNGKFYRLMERPICRKQYLQ